MVFTCIIYVIYYVGWGVLQIGSDRTRQDNRQAPPISDGRPAPIEAAKHLVLSNCEPKHIFLEYACTGHR